MAELHAFETVYLLLMRLDKSTLLVTLVLIVLGVYFCILSVNTQNMCGFTPGTVVLWLCDSMDVRKKEFDSVFM